MEILIDNKSYNVIIEKKKNKNSYIRVTEDLLIKVTVPLYYNNKMIEKMINENIKSIKKMINGQIKRNNTKIKDDSSFLGKSINIIYKDVKKPLFDGLNLIIKDDKMKDKWYRLKAFEVFSKVLDEKYDLFEEKIIYPSLKVRQMKTRWGVCNKKNKSVTLNLELIKKDIKYLEYVTVHELSHLVHFNHSKKFWLVVEKYCPDYKIIKKELKE